MPNEFIIKNGFISQGNSIVNGSLTATTYYGDGSNLTGTPNFYVTGGTYSNGTLTLNRQNGSVTITGFTTGFTTVDTYVTGFTYDNSNKLTVSRNNGLSDINVYLNQFSGLTVNGIVSATTFNGSGIGLNNIPISGVTNLQNSLDSKFSISGGTVTGDVLVLGNVTILGTATTINTTTLTVQDNIITLNSNATGSTSPLPINSGIEILRNSGTTASVLWEETNGYWSAGLNGSTKKIILEGDSLALLTSGHTHPISEINGLQTVLNNKFDTSGGTITGNVLINGSLTATTYYGDGSNLTGLVTNDFYVTGGTFDSTTNTLTLGRQNGSVTITGFTDYYVTGLTYNSQNKITLSQNNQEDLDVYLNQFSGISINGLSLPNGYTLSVTGDTIFNGDVYVNGDLNYNGSVIVTGSTIIQNGLTANTIYTDYIDFNTAYTGQTLPVGRLQWDDGNGTLVLGLKGGLSNMELGLENMALCYNADSVTLTAGTMVYVSGSQGNRPAIKRALATSDGYSVTTLGMVSESIVSGAEGFVTTYGMVNNLGTYGLTGGTALWLSPTIPGGYTDVKPQAPNHTVLIGYVVRVPNNPGQMVGSVFVNISNGWEIDELHDVRISGATEGDLLIRSSYNGSSVWVNSKTLNGNYTISGNTNNIGSLSATTFYGSGLGLNNIPISGVTNLQNSLDLKTDLTLFNSHTANTSNPHQTSFSQLTSTAHTHTISDVIDLQTNLNLKFDKSGGTVTGDVLVLGNVTILGSATTINTQTLSIADNVVTLNSNLTGGTPFPGHSGIEVLRGSGTTAALLWEEQNLQWEAGLHGTTKRIILQGDSLALLNSGHTHPISEINNLQTTLDDKLSKTSGGTVVGSTRFNGGLTAYTYSDLDDLVIPFKSIGIFDPGDPPTYPVNQTTIGGYFESLSGSNRYSLQLKDGTEGLNKVLVSKTTDGKANWSDTLNVNSVSATTYYGNFAYVSNIIATNSFSSSTYSTNVGNTQVVFSNSGSLSGTSNLTWANSRLNISGGLNVIGNTILGSITGNGETTLNGNLTVTGNTLVNGSVLALNNISTNNKLFILTTPVSSVTSTQILMRNSTTGEVEITDNTSPNIFNYGLANAMINLNFLT